MGVGERIARRLIGHPAVERGAARIGYGPGYPNLAQQFKIGDKVALGNGDIGKVIKECVGPTGFKSYRVQVTASSAPMTVGRRVYSTVNGMAKIAGLEPEIVASFYSHETNNRIAVVGCEIAYEEREQQIGLQKHSSLPQDGGMLFPYNPPQTVMFHMGSVQFPIDVIFINGSGVITDIQHNRSPGTDERWGSKGRVAGVLEVNGGFCRSRGIVPGDFVGVRTVKTAQEAFAPEEQSNRPDSSAPHALPSNLEKPALTPEQFEGRGQTPDQILNPEHGSPMAEPLDKGHWDSQHGYDPTQSFGDSVTTRPGPGF